MRCNPEVFFNHMSRWRPASYRVGGEIRKRFHIPIKKGKVVNTRISFDRETRIREHQSVSTELEKIN